MINISIQNGIKLHTLFFGWDIFNGSPQEWDIYGTARAALYSIQCILISTHISRSCGDPLDICTIRKGTQISRSCRDHLDISLIILICARQAITIKSNAKIRYLTMQ